MLQENPFVDSTFSHVAQPRLSGEDSAKLFPECLLL
jgi:hypothetical protein